MLLVEIPSELPLFLKGFDGKGHGPGGTGILVALIAGRRKLRREVDLSGKVLVGLGIVLGKASDGFHLFELQVFLRRERGQARMHFG